MLLLHLVQLVQVIDHEAGGLLQAFLRQVGRPVHLVQRGAVGQVEAGHGVAAPGGGVVHQEGGAQAGQRRLLRGLAAIGMPALLDALGPGLAGQAQGLAVVAHTGLRERAFGDFEGRTFAEIEAELPEHARHWRQRTPDWAPPGAGESLLALRERVLATVDELAARHVGEQIALVAHGGVMDVLYRAATRLDVQAARTWQLPNTAVNRLLWTPEGLSLVGWADTTHLDGQSLDELA